MFSLKSMFAVICADFAACFLPFCGHFSHFAPNESQIWATSSSCCLQYRLLLRRRLRLEDVAQTVQVEGNPVQANHPASESSGAWVMPHL
jgi:hypothetical protein